MADLPHEVEQVASRFGDLSRVLPTSELREMDMAMGTLALSVGKTSEGLGGFNDVLHDIRRETALSKTDFAQLAESIYRSTNRLSLSLKELANVSKQVSAIDPLNAETRIKDLQRYAPLLGRLTGDLKNSKEAYRLLAIAEGEHNYQAAATIRGMISGEKATKTYTLSVKSLAAVFKDSSLSISQFTGNSVLAQKAISLLATDSGSAIIKMTTAVLAAQAAHRSLGFLFAGGGGPAVPGAPPTAGARFAAFRGGRGMMAAGIAGGAIAAGSYLATRGDESKSSSVLGGALTGAGIGGTVLGPYGALAGAGIGALVAVLSHVKPTVDPATTATKNLLSTFEGVASAADSLIESLEKSFTGDTKEGVRRASLSARSELAQQLASMGAIGPQVQMKVATEMIDSIKMQYAVMREEKAKFIQDTAQKSGDMANAVAAGNAKFDTALMGLQSKMLAQTVNYRRSILEQFTASAINAPGGSYSMPGGLSDRQKYGGSYYDFMSLDNIRGRPQQQRSQDYYGSKFAPTISSAIGSVGMGFANGGLIPGAPSAKDNRISAVASGEFVVNSAAVQHYGPSLFQSLNSLAAPKFADGGYNDEVSRIRGNLPWWQGKYSPFGATSGDIDSWAQNSIAHRSVLARQQAQGKISSAQALIMRQKIEAATNVNASISQNPDLSFGSGIAAAVKRDAPYAGLFNGGFKGALQGLATGGDLVNTAWDASGNPTVRGMPTPPMVPIDFHGGGFGGYGGNLSNAMYRQAQYGRDSAFSARMGGRSRLTSGSLGGHTHNTGHNFFSDDVFSGGSHVRTSAGHASGAGGGVKVSDDRVVKALNDIKATIIQVSRGFSTGMQN